MSDSNFYPIIFKQIGYSANIGLAVMIWEQHFWLDNSCCIDQLLYCHGEWLVAWKESDINVFDFSHFRNIFSVSGNVDS